MRKSLITTAIALASLPGLQTAQALSVTLVPKESRIPITQGIALQLTYLNDGDSPIFLIRPRSFGKGLNSLRILAKRKGCTFDVKPRHLDVAVEDLKFFFVPLLSGDRLTEKLPMVGQATSYDLLELFLPGPGQYELAVELNSVGDTFEAFVGPIWRGSIKSDSVVITLLPPSSEEVTKWRMRLKACVANESCMANPAVRYFSHVADARAIPFLTQALQLEPNDTYAAEALFRQATPEAISALRAAARKPETDSGISSYYLSLIERREKSAPEQKCPETLEKNW